jgi:hypothetical protein
MKTYFFSPLTKSGFFSLSYHLVTFITFCEESNLDWKIIDCPTQYGKLSYFFDIPQNKIAAGKILADCQDFFFAIDINNQLFQKIRLHYKDDHSLDHKNYHTILKYMALTSRVKVQIEDNLLDLSQEYDAIHIRRGDKITKEHTPDYSPDWYGMYLSKYKVKNCFVATDSSDFARRIHSPNVNFYMRANMNEYDQDKLNASSSAERIQNTLLALADVQMLVNAHRVIAPMWSNLMIWTNILRKDNVIKMTPRFVFNPEKGMKRTSLYLHSFNKIKQEVSG